MDFVGFQPGTTFRIGTWPNVQALDVPLQQHKDVSVPIEEFLAAQNGENEALASEAYASTWHKNGTTDRSLRVK